MTTTNAPTREQVEAAIRAYDAWGGSPEEPAEGDMRDQFSGYLDACFESQVADVFTALEEAGLFAGNVVLNWTGNLGEGTVEGAQVEAVLPRRGYVAASWAELKHFTDDRDATGIDGLVAIASALIDYANASLTLAQPLIDAQNAQIAAEKAQNERGAQ